MKFTKPMEIGEPISLNKARKDMIVAIGGVPLSFHIAFYQRLDEEIYQVISVLFYPRIHVRYFVWHEPLPIKYIDSLVVESGL